MACAFVGDGVAAGHQTVDRLVLHAAIGGGKV